MKAIELQSKGEIANGEKLLYSNDFSNNGWNKLKSKKMILIISISIILIIAIILIIVFATRTSSKKNETEKEPINSDKDSDDIKKEYKKEDFYSERTKSYYNLINNLEEENSILYHWNLEKDENNNKAIFKNKYQHLYNYSTDLKPVNESIGYHLFFPENYGNNTGVYSIDSFYDLIIKENKLLNHLYINSNDLLNFFIGELHKELNTKKTNMPLNENNEYEGLNEKDALCNYLEIFTKNNNSIISKNLFGLLKSKIICQGCKKEIYKFKCYSF